jgi:hypothetical protein
LPGCEEQPITDVKRAAKSLVDQLDPARYRVALVSFAAIGTLDQGLTDDFGDVKDAIDDMDAFGFTNIADGVFDAQAELDATGREGAVQIMVVLSNGLPNRYGDPPVSCPTEPSSPTPCTDVAIEEAAVARGKGTYVFTIGLDLDDMGESAEDLARDVLQDMATSPHSKYYFEARDSRDLEDIFDEIAGTVAATSSAGINSTYIPPLDAAVVWPTSRYGGSWTRTGGISD